MKLKNLLRGFSLKENIQVYSFGNIHFTGTVKEFKNEEDSIRLEMEVMEVVRMEYEPFGDGFTVGYAIEIC